MSEGSRYSTLPGGLFDASYVALVRLYQDTLPMLIILPALLSVPMVYEILKNYWFNLHSGLQLLY